MNSNVKTVTPMARLKDHLKNIEASTGSLFTKQSGLNHVESRMPKFGYGTRTKGVESDHIIIFNPRDRTFNYSFAISFYKIKEDIGDVLVVFSIEDKKTKEIKSSTFNFETIKFKLKELNNMLSVLTDVGSLTPEGVIKSIEKVFAINNSGSEKLDFDLTTMLVNKIKKEKGDLDLQIEDTKAVLDDQEASLKKVRASVARAENKAKKANSYAEAEEELRLAKEKFDAISTIVQDAKKEAQNKHKLHQLSTNLRTNKSKLDCLIFTLDSVIQKITKSYPFSIRDAVKNELKEK